jgi:type IV secretory pathway VirB10-like protein
MADEKKSDFVVSDRRKFTIDGELKPDAAVEEKAPEPTKEKVVEMKRPAAQEAPPPPPQQRHEQPQAQQTEEQPPPPTADEQKEQAAAYRAQTADIDARIQKELDQRSPGRKASDFEITFEKFVASLYMTALMQLGLVHEQGMQTRPDIMAARQTIDTISLLGEKTKGNLTPAEETLFQNVLYELRMAYVEVTNAITKMPQGPIDPNAGLK